MDAGPDDPFDVPLADLRRRRSAKWTRYDPDVLPAWVAEMDVRLAPAVTEVLHDLVRLGDTGYPGDSRLPEAFAAFATRRWGWTPDPERSVVTGDVVSSLTAVLQAVTEPGDGVVVTPPVYPPFFRSVTEAGARVVHSPLLGRDRGFALDLDRLERDLAAPGVTALVLCHPHNPAGRVLDRATLLAVADRCQRHGVVVVSDEIHAPLALPGTEFVPFGSLDHPAVQRSITLTSPSKAYNLAGLKAALVVGNGAVAGDVVAGLPPAVTEAASLFGVLAGEAALDHGDAWLASVVAALDHRRHLLRDLLDQHLPQVGYLAPEAGYLAWLDCRGLGLGDDPAAAFLERGRVALNSGPTFGPGGEGHARLNLATSVELVTEAVRRMAVAVGDRT